MTDVLDHAVTAAASGRWSLDPTRYTDPAIFEAELEVFRRNWWPVARVVDLKEPGSYVARDVAGEPIVVARCKDGSFTALSNVCRHRAIVMLEGEGRASAIQCPYHKWVYDWDGALQGAPFMDDSPNFLASDCSLPRFPVEAWLGWLFVNLDGRAEPLAPTLTELEAKLPSDIGDWPTVASTTYPSPFNWKIITENGSESYHNIGSHAATIQSIWPGGQSYGVPTNGRYSEARHSVDPVLGTFAAYTIFPAMTFTVSEPDPMLLWYDLEVSGPADCVMHLRIAVPSDRASDLEYVERLRATINTIHLEDIVTCGKVQRGVRARSAAKGPLAKAEQPITMLHDWLDRELAAL